MIENLLVLVMVMGLYTIEPMLSIVILVPIHNLCVGTILNHALNVHLQRLMFVHFWSLSVLLNQNYQLDPVHYLVFDHTKYHYYLNLIFFFFLFINLYRFLFANYKISNLNLMNQPQLIDHPLIRLNLM